MRSGFRASAGEPARLALKAENGHGRRASEPHATPPHTAMNVNSALRSLLVVTLAGVVVPGVAGCGDDDGAGPVATDVGADADAGAGADAAADTDTGASPDVTSDVAADADDVSVDADAGGGESPFEVPMAADSPWPKFRHDARQTGATQRVLSDDGSPLWVFPTGKGIFSSPVVAGDGTVYVGSANRFFYALNADGTERWRFETGEIIDSAALLDDRGRVYFGSGDGRLYALDAATGDQVWAREADDPGVNGAYINWFEGNVAIGPGGDLYVPNDNFFVYAIDRDDGSTVWTARMGDQTWSLPAVDPQTGNVYWGNNNVVPGIGNTYAYTADGDELWRTGVEATISGSPLLLDDRFVLGAFDGWVRAYDLDDGGFLWEVPTRDHVYASAALHPDGFVVIPSADGTVYALDPADGEQVWAFDWNAPIRSSPAIDGDGNVYVGAGNGTLLVLGPDGALRWGIELITDDRDDLNASPALGEHGIYIAGESGEVFGVPFDFCLRDEEAGNARCILGGEPLPDDGVFVQFTTEFGTPLAVPPGTIRPNQPLAFTLSLREGGDTRLSLIDGASLVVEVVPDVPVEVEVSGNRQFVTVVPTDGFDGDTDGMVSVSLRGDYLIDPERDGLRMTGGTVAGSFDETFTFALSEPATSPDLSVPDGTSGTSTWVLRRLAAPLPTLLPSYNQIGFDSLYYLVSVVEGDQASGVMWVVEGAPEEGGVTAVPGTRGMFPFEYTYSDGLLTLVNRDGAALEVLNFAIGFDTFRTSGVLGSDGSAQGPMNVQATTTCGEIDFYGAFLQRLGLCNPETDSLVAFGAALLESVDGGTTAAPSDAGTVAFELVDGAVVATLSNTSLRADEHATALVIVDPATGSVVPLPYGLEVRRTASPEGLVQSVSMALGDGDLPDAVRAWLMVDSYPVASAELSLIDP